MKLKKIGVPFITICCIVIVLFSYNTWNEKLDSIQSGAIVSETNKLQSEQETKKKTKEADNTDSKINLNDDELAQMIENTDASVKKILQSRFDAGEKVQMLIIGSDALEIGEQGYGKRLADAVTESYEGFIEPTVLSFNTTSRNFILENLDDIKWKSQYDLVLFEPFVLNDNGIITIEDEHANIQSFIDKVKENVSDAVVVLQPSYPIYNTIYYKNNVQALQQFALEQNLPYINHWEQWPNTDDPTIQQYLTENKYPNEQGIDLWSAALIKYFTNQ